MLATQRHLSYLYPFIITPNESNIYSISFLAISLLWNTLYAMFYLFKCSTNKTNHYVINEILVLKFLVNKWISMSYKGNVDVQYSLKFYHKVFKMFKLSRTIWLICHISTCWPTAWSIYKSALWIPPVAQLFWGKTANC